jgi:hypothetical protein
MDWGCGKGDRTGVLRGLVSGKKIGSRILGLPIFSSVGMDFEPIL